MKQEGQFTYKEIKEKNMENVNLASKPLTFGQQIRYGFCEIASNPMYTIMASFLTYFYTDVLGINPAIVGSLLLACKIFDGVSDVTAGNIIEHTHTKKGSARPWILRSAIPLALSVILLFTVPDCGDIGKYIYIFISYNFSMTVCYTMFGAAISVLPLYATTDVASRGAAFAVRICIAGVVQSVLLACFMNVIEFLGGGQKAWIILSVIIGAISLASSFVTYYSLEEHANPKLNKALAETKTESVPVKESLKALAKNKYWFMVIGLMVCILFHQVTTLTVGVYYATWVLDDVVLAGKISLFHMGPSLLALFLTPVFLAKGFSKGKLCFISSIVMILGGAVGILSGSSDLLFYASLALRGIGYGIISGVMNAMVADSLVYGEWKTGVATPAIGMCVQSLVGKVMGGVVTAAFGLAIGLSGYDGTAASQPESAIWFIRMFFMVFPVVLYVLQTVLMKYYDLDDKLQGIVKELEERHHSAK